VKVSNDGDNLKKNYFDLFFCVYIYLRNSVTNYFLVNLSVADLLVTMICMPMAMSQNITVIWFYGLFMCKFVTYLQGKQNNFFRFSFLLFRTYLFDMKAKKKKSNVDAGFFRICLRTLTGIQVWVVGC
jgi:hypothetical protein